MKTMTSGDSQGAQRFSVRTIVATFIVTTLFWADIVGVLIWRGGKPGASWQLTQPGTLEVHQGAYHVQVVATHPSGEKVLLSHTASAPAKVVLTLDRLDTKFTQGYQPLAAPRHPQVGFERTFTDLLDFRYQPEAGLGLIR